MSIFKFVTKMFVLYVLNIIEWQWLKILSDIYAPLAKLPDAWCALFLVQAVVRLAL